MRGAGDEKPFSGVSWKHIPGSHCWFLAAAFGWVSTSHSSCALLCPSTVGTTLVPGWPLKLQLFETITEPRQEDNSMQSTSSESLLYVKQPQVLNLEETLCYVCTLVQVWSSFLFLFCFVCLFLRQGLMYTHSPVIDLPCMVYWAALGPSPWAELDRTWAGLLVS